MSSVYDIVTFHDPGIHYERRPGRRMCESVSAPTGVAPGMTERVTRMRKPEPEEEATRRPGMGRIPGPVPKLPSGMRRRGLLASHR